MHCYKQVVMKRWFNEVPCNALCSKCSHIHQVITLDQLNKIKQDGALAARILYDLSGLTKDNLWLKKLSKDETKIEIEGRSVDNETLCDFIEKLTKLPYLKNIELKSVEDVSEYNMTVKKFILNGSAP